jgi:hypothetical protein
MVRVKASVLSVLPHACGNTLALVLFFYVDLVDYPSVFIKV